MLKYTFRALIFIGLILLISFIMIYFQYFKDNATKLSIVYGEKLPEFNLKNIKSEDYLSFTPNNKNNIIFYLSETCSTCINNLTNYKDLIDQLDINSSYFFIWQDTAPLELIESLNISIEHNYELNNEFILSSQFPNYFIVDEYSDVIFSTIDLNSLKNKIKSIVN